MATYNTGNPIGSTDSRDRLDNTENMDYLENSTTELTHADRLGTVRKTRHGMEVEHDAQIAAHETEHDAQMQSFENDFDSRLVGMAFTRVGTFTAGATLTDMRQTLLWEVSQGGDGHEYGWTGSFGTSGKAVAAGSSPSPIAAGSWVDRTDVTLRSDLASESGSGLVGYQPAGTGAVATTVQAELRKTVRVENFGPIGNSTTGDDATFQAALDYIHKLSDDSGVFGELHFTGTIYLASPKNFGKNMVLIGGGRSFKSVIKPLASFSGAYLFGIDGDNCIGGYAFRIRHEGFTIDNSLITTKAQLPLTYSLNKSYDIALRDVWIYNARGTGVSIGDSNLIVLEDCSFYGVSTNPSDSEYAVRVISAGSGGGGGGVKLINPDFEVWYKALRQEGDALVDVINPYFERNIVGWEAVGNTSGHFSVFGGQVESPGASGIAAYINGDNVTVVGGRYVGNGGVGLYVQTAARKSNVKILGVSGSISDGRNYAYKEVAETTRWYPSRAKNQKDVSDAVATDFYNIVCPFNSGYFGVCEVTINARDLSGYSLWTAKYRFAFSNPDGTLRVTAITEYAKANVNISANYSLAITTALSTAGTTITFRITGDSGGALGNGQSPRISTEAEMVQWDSAGQVYIQAV